MRLIQPKQKLNVAIEILSRQARQDFGVFRHLMHPDLLTGWWVRQLHDEISAFDKRMLNGERPKLILSAPPQHGKSSLVMDYIAWLAGRFPDMRTIYTSFSQQLGYRASRTFQRLVLSPAYQRVFPELKINEVGKGSASRTLASRNLSHTDFIGRKGYYVTTTVQGSITGQSMDIGVVDDPIKGYEQSMSQTVRDNTWSWFTDNFMTRFSEIGAMLVIGTRWHLDDPLGRMRDCFPDAKVISYAAIAECDEKHRREGEALFPQLKSESFLNERKAIMLPSQWAALYQGNPQLVGGNLIKTEQLLSYTVAPSFKFRVITADTALKTREAHDYSVLQCWGCSGNGHAYLIDQMRGKWEAPELERNVIAFWDKHKSHDPSQWGRLREMSIEDHASGTGLIQHLKASSNIPIKPVVRSRDKYTRVMDVLPYIASGYVHIPSGTPWLADFIAELAEFSADGQQTHDDQVDAMVDGVLYCADSSASVNIWANIL